MIKKTNILIEPFEKIILDLQRMLRDTSYYNCNILDFFGSSTQIFNLKNIDRTESINCTDFKSILIYQDNISENKKERMQGLFNDFIIKINEILSENEFEFKIINSKFSQEINDEIEQEMIHSFHFKDSRPCDEYISWNIKYFRENDNHKISYSFEENKLIINIDESSFILQRILV